MKKRLPDALPIALLLFGVLIFTLPGTVIAQQSRSADSEKANAKERTERGRSSAREAQAQSQRTRDAAGAAANRTRDVVGAAAARARDAQRDRETRDAGEAAAARSNESPRARSSVRTQSQGRGATGDSNRRSTSGEARTGRDTRTGRDNTPARNRTAPERRSDRRNDGGDHSNDRGNRSDNRGDRSDDRGNRWDRDSDRGSRDYDRRDDRNRRRGNGMIIVNPPPKPNTWARPRVHVDISWPWVHRHQRRWSPRYRYRQVVYVDAGWGRSRRESRLDLRTFYRHRVLEASSRRAVVDIQIDRIEIYEDGFFVGEVRSIPPQLAGMRAVVDRRRGVQFDRDVFLLGDPYVGFEIISTRHYDGFVLNRYRTSHGIKVGVLDFRRERVTSVRRSRFFDPRDFSGFVPINLLPEDAGWLIDYGYESYSGHYWGDDDRYYYGFSDVNDYTRQSDERAQYSQTDPRGTATGREAVSSRITPERQALERSADRTVETDAGATIRLQRESSIERVD